MKNILKKQSHIFDLRLLSFREIRKDSCLYKRMISIGEFLRQKDPILKSVMESVALLLLPQHKNTFDCFIDIIIAQQVSIRVAKTMSQRLRILFDSQKISPDTVMMKEKDDFISIGLSAKKYQTIRDFSKFLQTHSLSLSHFEQQTDDHIRKSLISIKGIGPWTVDMYLIFGLGRLDIFPEKDLILDKTISFLYNVERGNFKKIKSLSNEWKPYRSIAGLYLYEFFKKKKCLIEKLM